MVDIVFSLTPGYLWPLFFWWCYFNNVVNLVRWTLCWGSERHLWTMRKRQSDLPEPCFRGHSGGCCGVWGGTRYIKAHVSQHITGSLNALLGQGPPGCGWTLFEDYSSYLKDDIWPIGVIWMTFYQKNSKGFCWSVAQARLNILLVDKTLKQTRLSLIDICSPLNVSPVRLQRAVPVCQYAVGGGCGTPSLHQRCNTTSDPLHNSLLLQDVK